MFRIERKQKAQRAKHGHISFRLYMLEQNEERNKIVIHNSTMEIWSRRSIRRKAKTSRKTDEKYPKQQRRNSSSERKKRISICILNWIILCLFFFGSHSCSRFRSHKLFPFLLSYRCAIAYFSLTYIDITAAPGSLNGPSEYSSFTVSFL